MERRDQGGARRVERLAYRAMQRRADRIVSLILGGDYPAVDVAIEIRNLRHFVEARLPGRVGLFEMVLVSRFERLWSQFRAHRDGPLPQWR